MYQWFCNLSHMEIWLLDNHNKNYCHIIAQVDSKCEANFKNEILLILHQISSWNCGKSEMSSKMQRCQYSIPAMTAIFVAIIVGKVTAVAMVLLVLIPMAKSINADFVGASCSFYCYSYDWHCLQWLENVGCRITT